MIRRPPRSTLFPHDALPISNRSPGERRSARRSVAIRSSAVGTDRPGTPQTCRVASRRVVTGPILPVVGGPRRVEAVVAGPCRPGPSLRCVLNMAQMLGAGMADQTDLRRDLLMRINARRAGVEAFLRERRPRISRRVTVTLVLSSLSAVFTAGPALGGVSFADLGRDHRYAAS